MYCFSYICVQERVFIFTKFYECKFMYVLISNGKFII